MSSVGSEIKPVNNSTFQSVCSDRLQKNEDYKTVKVGLFLLMARVWLLNGNAPLLAILISVDSYYCQTDYLWTRPVLDKDRLSDPVSPFPVLAISVWNNSDSDGGG